MRGIVDGVALLVGNVDELAVGARIDARHRRRHVPQLQVLTSHLNVTELADGSQKVRIELPAVAVDVPEGQTLYLLVSAVSDTFAGMNSRAPGVVLLDETDGAPARRRLIHDLP